MSYKIDWQSNDAEGMPGKAAITLPNKTLNTTSTSLTLTGKGINNYGEIQQENFLHLMEHFSSGVPPQNPTIGQIWFNTAETILYMRVDPAVVGPMHPLYHPQSPAAWVQIWPDSGANTYAGLAEYNALGIEINRIIGLPSVFGSQPDSAYEQWGWGQNDLVPIYDNVNTLAAGFSPAIFPPVFDNNAWVILLSRLRKALRHVGISEMQASPIGFINDNRPFGPLGNALANDYNDYPAVGTLADYKAGWQNFGTATVQLHYANTLNSISSLIGGRFTASPLSTEMLTLGTVSRSAPWTSSVSQSVSMTFATHDNARSYFNSGGTFAFNFNLASPGADMLSASWANFLSNQSNLIFDFKGVRHGTTYHNGPAGVPSLGFYDLTTTPQLIYEVKRNYGGAYYSIYDGGLQIFSHKIYNGDGTCTINFNIVFAEAPYPGESVTGTLTSSQIAFKANSLNVNSPLISYPSWTGSSIDNVVPAPAPGPAEGTGSGSGGSGGGGSGGFSITSSTTNVNEGGSVTFNFITSGIANGQPVYWTITGSNNSSDFVGGVSSGNVIVNSNAASLVLTLANDLTTEGTESFALQLRTGGLAGTIMAISNTIYVVDTSITPAPVPTVTGVEIRKLSNSGSPANFSINENSSVNLYAMVLYSDSSSAPYSNVIGSNITWSETNPYVTLTGASGNQITLNTLSVPADQAAQSVTVSITTSAGVFTDTVNVAVLDVPVTYAGLQIRRNSNAGPDMNGSTLIEGTNVIVYVVKLWSDGTSTAYPNSNLTWAAIPVDSNGTMLTLSSQSGNTIFVTAPQVSSNGNYGGLSVTGGNPGESTAANIYVLDSATPDRAPTVSNARIKLQGQPAGNSNIFVTHPSTLAADYTFDQGQPANYATYVWYRSGVPISGLDQYSGAYATQSADIGNSITYTVTLSNYLGTVSSTSSNSAVVSA
jgi:hypothetical protein